MENGFKVMSQAADADVVGTASGAYGDRPPSQFGRDDEAGDTSNNERAGDLQQLLIDEVRKQPMRALGWAAAAGFVIGFWAAK